MEKNTNGKAKDESAELNTGEQKQKNKPTGTPFKRKDKNSKTTGVNEKKSHSGNNGAGLTGDLNYPGSEIHKSFNPAEEMKQAGNPIEKDNEGNTVL